MVPAGMILPLYSTILTVPVTTCWRRINKSGQSLTQRSEPLTGVYQFRKLNGQLLFIGVGLLIQHHMLQLLMSLVHDGSARSLINAAGLHADNTVLQNIYDTDTILAAQLIELGQKSDRIHLFTIQSDRNTLFKVQADFGSLIRSLLRVTPSFSSFS